MFNLSRIKSTLVLLLLLAIFPAPLRYQRTYARVISPARTYFPVAAQNASPTSDCKKFFGGWDTNCLVRQLRSDSYFAISYAQVADDQLTKYVDAHKDELAAILLQVDYGRNLSAVLYSGATSFPEEQAYLDALQSKQKLNEFNGYLADAIHLYSLAKQGDAVYLGALSEMIGQLSKVLQGIEVYKKFSGVLKLADERQILFEYFQQRFNLSTGEIRSDEQQVWAELVNTYEPILQKIAALRGIKKDPLNNLHEWYKNAFYSYLLVGYGDYSVNLRQNQGKIIAQLARPVVNTFTIENDADTTQSRDVFLNATLLGVPYEYQASEDALFTGAKWQKLRVGFDPLFTLSPGEGVKKVYFRVRNREGVESSGVSDRILYTLTPPTPTPTPTTTPTPEPTATPTPMPGSCAPVTGGLVSMWKGEGNASDNAGGNSGTLLGGGAFAPGEVGQAFSFDGVDDYVEIPDSGSLDSVTAAATVEGWVKPGVPDTLREYIFARRDPNASEGLSLAVYNDGKLAVIIRTANSPTVSGSTFVTAPGVITFNQWQHVAATVDTPSGSVKVYINGQPYPVGSIEGPDSFSGDLVNVNHLFIGRREDNSAQGTTGAAYFKGGIDELSLFNRALSAAEVTSIYAAGSDGKCEPTRGSCAAAPANLLSLWKGEGNANDSVGANNGVLQNGVVFAPGIVGQAFSLDGVNQYVEITNRPGLHPTQAITVETWVRLAAMPPYSITSGWDPISNNGPAQGSHILRVMNDGSVVFGILKPGTINWQIVQTSQGLVTPGTFFHLAGTYDSATGMECVYVNGVSTCSQFQGGVMNSTSNPLTIGSDNWNQVYFRGEIDEPAIYSRALTASEIQGVYNAGSAGKCGASIISGSTQIGPAVGQSCVNPALATTVFYDHPSTFTYARGTVLLSSTPDGSGAISTDDEVRIDVTRPDGGIASFSYVFGYPRNSNGVETLAPQDVSNLFQVGLNSVRVRYIDNSLCASSTSYYLTLIH